MQSEGIYSTSNSYDTDIIPQDFIEGGTEGRIANSLFQLNEAPLSICPGDLISKLVYV